MISMVRPLGMDVSHWQGVVDWEKARGAGISFAFAKASEGVNWVDDTYLRNFLEARRVDILFGAFHWFIPWEDALLQAEWFLKCAPEPGGLPYVVDVEDRRRVPAGYGEKVRKFCEWVTRESGQKTVIYTGAAYWNQFLGDADWAGEYPLWVANYKRAEGPLVPAPWYPGGWFAWQFTAAGKGARYGVQSKAVDLDVGNWVGS